MDNTLYLVRDKSSDAKISSFIQRYNFELCYDQKKEKVLKNEDMLLLLKRKYIFIHIFCDTSDLFSEVQEIFKTYEK